MIALNNIDIFAIVRAALEPWVMEKGGVFSIARDPYEVIELLGQSPGRFRVMLKWDGEITQSHHASGIVAHQLGVIVSHNRGLSALKGANLTVARGNDAPLLSLVNEVRDRLRGLVLPETQTAGLLEYLSTETVQIEQYPLDAYQLNFRVQAAIPEPDYTPAP